MLSLRITNSFRALVYFVTMYISISYNQSISYDQLNLLRNYVSSFYNGFYSTLLDRWWFFETYTKNKNASWVYNQKTILTNVLRTGKRERTVFTHHKRIFHGVVLLLTSRSQTLVSLQHPLMSRIQLSWVPLLRLRLLFCETFHKLHVERRKRASKTQCLAAWHFSSSRTVFWVGEHRLPKMKVSASGMSVYILTVFVSIRLCAESPEYLKINEVCLRHFVDGVISYLL